MEWKEVKVAHTDKRTGMRILHVTMKDGTEEMFRDDGFGRVAKLEGWKD